MAEIHFDLLNFNSLLVILLILVIGGYLYYEIYKLKSSIHELQYELDKKHVPIIHGGIPPITYQTENIERPSGDGKDSEWSHIHQQMNPNEEAPEDYLSESSEHSESPGEHSESPGEHSESPDPNEIVFPKNNNSANIDEILAGKNIITDNSLSDILNVDSDIIKIGEFINTIKASEETKIISTDYEKMTISQLKKILSDKELPVSGNKTKLIQRIKANNE